MTYIFLDTLDASLAEQVRDQSFPEAVVMDDKPWMGLLETNDNQEYIFYGKDMFGTDPKFSRMTQMAFAAHGGILFSNTMTDSPLYDGALPGNPGRLSVHAEFAQTRVARFRNPSVRYSGAILGDPKNVFIMDKADPQFMFNALENLPKNYWGTVGFAVVMDDDGFADVVDNVFFYSTLIATSPKSLSLIKSLDRDDMLVDASDLSPTDRKFGIVVRERSRRPVGFSVEVD